MHDETHDTGQPLPTIYDVARRAGVSIASVSRVLNDNRATRAETRERVRRAVAELGFVPDGAARALGSRLKEVVGVVVRRPPMVATHFADEDENLQFPDMINRGMELVAQRYGFDLLVRSVDLDGIGAADRISALARKSDGLILHDHVLDPAQLTRLARQIPVVTLAGLPTPGTVNVRSDNHAGVGEMTAHLIAAHGYRSLGFIAGHPDSPDSIARFEAVRQAAGTAGAVLETGELWQGNYSASGGAQAIYRLVAAGIPLPRAIVCANDQTAIGAIYALRQHGLRVPEDVAITGFDDIPVSRHLQPPLTTSRQPIQDLGATAIETLHSMILRKIAATAAQPGSRPGGRPGGRPGSRPGHDGHAGHPPRERPAPGREIVLPTRLVIRESCGCPPGSHPAPAPRPGPVPAIGSEDAA